MLRKRMQADVSCVFSSRKQQQTGLIVLKRYRFVRSDRCALHLACRTVHTGWNIDGKNIRTAGIDRLHARFRITAERSGQPRPKQSIHHEPRFFRKAGRNVGKPAARSLGAVQVYPRIPTICFFFRKQCGADVNAIPMQQSQNGQPIPAVVAASAQNEHLSVLQRGQPQKHALCDALRGALHQLDPGDTVFLGQAVVDLSHLPWLIHSLHVIPPI